MPETSIVIKLEDRYSTTLKQMAQVTKSFDKDAEELERTLHKLSGEKSILAVETEKARKVMKDAQRQFAATGDEADALRVSLAGQEYEDYRRKMEAVNKTMKETEKQIGKVERVSRNSGETIKKGVNEVVGAIAASGISSMLGGLAESISISYVESAFGRNAGNLFSSGLSGAISGAALGSIIPGVGTAVGAGIGGAIGAASGAIQNAQARDDTFKTYYASQYDTANAETAQSIASGSGYIPSTSSKRSRKSFQISRPMPIKR